MEPLALLGLVGLLAVKEAGVPVPVPGDLLVVAAGIASAGQGGVPPPFVLAAILAAGYGGGSLQFLLVRGTLRRFVLAVLGRVGVGRDRLDRLSGWLARRGARGVAIARATPAVRVGAIAASGLAGLRYAAFAALGAVGWRAIRRRRAAPMPGAAPGSGYGGWLEGACPACVLLTIAQPDAADVVGARVRRRWRDPR
jgi:membrane protein DedA with SNARE-associated domain